MRSFFIESLENRQFLSIGIVGAHLNPPPDAAVAAPVVMAPLAAKVVVKRMPKVGDVFKGTSKWKEGGHTVSVHITMKVTKLVKAGEYKVAGTSTDDRTAKYTYSVHLKKDGTFTFEFSGRNVNGSDTGKGSGKMSVNGRTLTGSNSSSQNPSRPTFSVALQ